MARNFSSARGWQFMDASPLFYRPDGHVTRGQWAGGRPKPVDCLHSCMPGPLDLFARLLLHHLHVNPNPSPSTNLSAVAAPLTP